MIEVIGPYKTPTGFRFGVRRDLQNFGTKKAFALKFEIKYDRRTLKWHHTSIGPQKDSLCRERLFAPTKDCLCIRECKKKMEGNWLTK